MRRSGFKPWEFLVVFLVVFFLFAVFLFAIDFVPESPKGNATPASATNAGLGTSAIAQAAAQMGKQLPEAPVRIEAPAVGINTPIGNPTSTAVSVLDNALLSGAVRYPDSALLGQNAPLYLFGHQSYLPVVHNQAYKAFNGLQKLKPGDDIVVYSASAAYHYTVRSVERVKADTALVDLSAGARTLVLTTCDSFGTKSDRYEVTADFASRSLLTNTNS